MNTANHNKRQRTQSNDSSSTRTSSSRSNSSSSKTIRTTRGQQSTGKSRRMSISSTGNNSKPSKSTKKNSSNSIRTSALPIKYNIRLHITFRKGNSNNATPKINHNDMICSDDYCRCFLNMSQQSSFEDIKKKITDFTSSSVHCSFLDGYNFDPKKYSNGGICAPNFDYINGLLADTSVSQSKLCPIRTQDDWIQLVRRSQSEKYGNNQIRKIVFLSVQLANVPKNKQAKTSKEKTTNRAVKQQVFPKTIEFEILAPLRKECNNGQGTLKPIDSTVYKHSFNLTNEYVRLKPNTTTLLQDAINAESSDSDTNGSDEHITTATEKELNSSSFTAAMIRIVLMRTAIESHSSYKVERKTLSKESILYAKTTWGSHSYQAIMNRTDLYDFCNTEMKKKNRYKQDNTNTLILKVAFGIKKTHGTHITGLDDEYLNYDPLESDVESDDGFEEGTSRFYSQDQNLLSPGVKKTGQERRNETYCQPEAISKFLYRMYRNEESPLHHGFTDKHMEWFARQLTVALQNEKKTIGEENGDLYKIIHSPDKLFSIEQTASYFIDPILQSHAIKNNFYDHLPRKNEYPPQSDDELGNVPPRLSTVIIGPQTNNTNANTVITPTPPQLQNSNNMASSISNNFCVQQQCEYITFIKGTLSATLILSDEHIGQSSTFHDIRNSEHDVVWEMREYIGWDKWSNYVFSVKTKGDNVRDLSFTQRTFMNTKIQSIYILGGVQVPLEIEIHDA